MKSIAVIILLSFAFTFCNYNADAQLWKQYSDSAKTMVEQKKLDKAIELYLQAKKHLEIDSLGTSTYTGNCTNLANLYTFTGKYEKAEPLYIEVRQIKEKVFGKESIDYAESCHNLAALYRYMGEYQKAEPLITQAKQLKEKLLGKENLAYAASCTELASLYLKMAQVEKAELFFLEAHRIKEKVLGKQHADYAKSCHSVGNLYASLAQLEKAEPFYLEARQLREKILGKDNPEYAETCHNLGNLYRILGQLEKAEPLMIEAKQIRKKILGKDHPDYAKSCNNLAILYDDMGQYHKAEALYLEAKQINENTFGTDHPEYAYSCHNLAVLYRTLGQYEKAEPLFLDAKRILEKTIGKVHYRYAMICNSLANLYKDMEQFQKAELYYMESKEIYEKVAGKGHPDYAGSCKNLGLLYNQMGEYQRAEPYFLEAKQIFEKSLGKEDKEYGLICHNLGTLYRNLKSVEKANELYAEGLAVHNEHIKKIFEFTSEEENFYYVKSIADFQDNLFSFYLSDYPHHKQGLAYDFSISHRNLILSSSRQVREAVNSSTDSSIKNKYDEWIKAREQLSILYSRPVTDRPANINELEEQANAQEKELTRLSLIFNKQKKQSRLNWKDIQRDLLPNDAAIEFVEFNYFNGKNSTDSFDYVALLLTKHHSEPELIPLFESRQLIKVLGKGNTLNTVASLYNGGRKSNPAFKLIWQPIEKRLQGITRIYYAPAGLLHRISFAALPINDHQVLGDKYQLMQVNTTASVVNQTERIIDATDNIYIYGAIKYDVDSSALKQAVLAYRPGNKESLFFLDESTRGNSWGYLPGTEREISQIGSLGKQKDYSIILASGVTASEESLKALNGKHSPSVLHIATHGFFFPDPKDSEKDSSGQRSGGSSFRLSDNPLLRSGLLFAGANNTWTGKRFEGLEDGILTAYEVSNLYLPNTKLVVLSACETGLGDIQGNEGVYGLQRAFKIAGVENLVMSLWKVPDNTTAEFMQIFYKNIFNIQSINSAFNNAQAEMKKKYRKDPYKWAAWILVR